MNSIDTGGFWVDSGSVGFWLLQHDSNQERNVMNMHRLILAL